MTLVLGFDPGGEGGFGWCVAELGEKCPLSVRQTGVAGNLASVLEAVREHVGPGDEIAAIGIDAPMFWKSSGDRFVDGVVRAALRKRRAPSPGGTVQHVNSLRGAYLVQGMLLGLHFRRQTPAVAITESHPKAMLWLLGHASRERCVVDIALASLTGEFSLPSMPRQSSMCATPRSRH